MYVWPVDPKQRSRKDSMPGDVPLVVVSADPHANGLPTLGSNRIAAAIKIPSPGT